MSTVADKPATAPAQSEAPVESLAEKFYGSPKKAVAETPAPVETPAPGSENGTPPPAKEPAPAEKVEEPPKGKADTEDEKHQAAAQRLGRKVKDLEHELELRDGVMNELRAEIQLLKDKAEGKDTTPKAKTPEEIRAEAIFAERERNSKIVAQERYGKEAVKKGIYDENSDYEKLVKRKPWLQIEVMRHESPTVRGMQLLALEDFTSTYGEDPGQWVAKILAEAEPKILEKFKSQTTTTPVGGEPPSISDARGDGGPPTREKSLADLFYGPGSVVK